MARDLDFLHGMNFGKGFDTLHINLRGDAVQSKTGSAPISVGGPAQSVAFSLLHTESFEDYQSSLTLNADAAAMFGLFGGSASFNFGQQRKFHSFSQFLVVSIQVQNPLLQIPDPVLTPSAHGLLAAGQTDQFQQEFGDSFVLGIGTGGLYYAILEFTSQSQEDLENISGKLEAGEFGVFATEEKFSSSISDFKGQTRLFINSFQIGGVGEGAKQEVNIDAIITKARKIFPRRFRMRLNPCSR